MIGLSVKLVIFFHTNVLVSMQEVTQKQRSCNIFKSSSVFMTIRNLLHESRTNMKPSMKLLKPATEWAVSAAKAIDVNVFHTGDIYQRIFQAWMCIAAGIFENMDIPLSACGEIEDIIDCLQPSRRRMRVEATENGCCIEYKRGSDRAHLSSNNDGAKFLTFKPYSHVLEKGISYDISCYGPDSVAAVIAALFKANRILEEKFQRQLYR